MKTVAAVIVGLLWCATAPAQATKPRILERTPPVYPPAEEQARHGGRVELRVDVNDRGGVDGVEVLQATGYPALDQAAIDAVKGWRFAPAKDAGGQASAGALSFALTFTPPGRDLDLEISCGEVSQQVAALRAASPQATVDQVPALGALMDLAQSMDEALPPNLQGLVMAELPSVYDRLLQACAANPGANMMDIYQKIIKSPDAVGGT
jgi:protein TonB